MIQPPHHRPSLHEAKILRGTFDTKQDNNTSAPSSDADLELQDVPQLSTNAPRALPRSRLMLLT
eukprot:5024572-Amphidinium_carterae.2